MKCIQLTTIGISLFLLGLTACNQKETVNKSEAQLKNNKQQFFATLETHLKAIKEKNLTLLKTTMPPNDTLYLTLPQTETTTSVDAFLKMHEDWFKEAGWTMETKIANIDIGTDLGVATVEMMYREEEREGKPYFNRMAVSYTLKKINENWYVIRDHASSIEKTK